MLFTLRIPLTFVSPISTYVSACSFMPKSKPTSFDRINKVLGFKYTSVLLLPLMLGFKTNIVVVSIRTVPFLSNMESLFMYYDQIRPG